MKDVLMVLLTAIVAGQCVWIWRLGRDLDRHDDVLDEVTEDLQAIVDEHDKIERMKHDQRNTP